MCSDPTCTACQLKKRIENEAHPLAKVLSQALTAELRAGRISPDLMPLSAIRACAGVIAALCHGADSNREQALSRAMSDVADLYNQMGPEDSHHAIVVETLSGTAKEVAEKLSRVGKTTVH